RKFLTCGMDGESRNVSDIDRLDSTVLSARREYGPALCNVPQPPGQSAHVLAWTENDAGSQDRRPVRPECCQHSRFTPGLLIAVLRGAILGVRAKVRIRARWAIQDRRCFGKRLHWPVLIDAHCRY